MSVACIPKKIFLLLILLPFVVTPLFSATFEEDFQRADKHLRKGQSKDVLQIAASIRKRAEAQNDLSSAGRANILSAQASYTLGKMDDMKKFIYEAIEIFKQTGEKRGLGKAFYVYSMYFQKTGDAFEMKKHLQHAKEYADQSDDPELQIRIFTGLGLANWNLGQYREAIHEINKGVEIAKKVKDHHLLAIAYEGIALNYSSRGELSKALSYYQKALSFFEEEKNSHAQAYVQGNMGVTYERMGDLESAMKGYEKSFSIHEKNGYIFGQCIQTDNMAQVHHLLEQHEKSIELSLKAISLCKDEGAWLKVQLLQNIAKRFLSAGDLNQSRFYAMKASEELEKTSNPHIKLQNQLLLSELAQKLGNVEEALTVSRTNIKITEAMGDIYHLGIFKGTEAAALAESKNLTEAEAAYREAIEHHEKIYARSFVPRWYADLAKIMAEQGRTKEALRHYEKSVQSTVQIADLLLMDRFRIDLLRQAAEIYREYSSYLASLGKTTEAWKIVEEGRARDLQLRIAQATGGPGMKDEERDLLGLIHNIQNNISTGKVETSALPQMYSRLTSAAAAYQNLQKRNGSFAQNWTPSSSIDQKDSILIEYAFHNNELMVFSTAEGETRFRRIDDAGKINQLAAKYIGNISANKNTRLDLSTAMQLYEHLLEPELRNGPHQQIVIVPDGILHSLPFAALQNKDGKFVAETYIVSYTPSLRMLKEIKQRERSYEPGKIMAIAATNFSGLDRPSMKLPPLPLAREEAEKVSRFGIDPLLVIDQPESAIKNTDLSSYELIHFATHSVIDEIQPEHSSLVLRAEGKEDGYLKAEEIYGLRIPGSTIFLSSCRSGSGKFVSGEGILGLPHAFFAAGAGSMVMSYWNIRDDEAEVFSSRFYENLLKYPVAAALQRTQQYLMKTDDYNHPRIWGAFFIYGDGFRTLELRNPDTPKWAGIALLGVMGLLLLWIIKRRSERNSPIRPSISAKG